VFYCYCVFVGGYCYDITDFVKNHPGGSEKILMAAGSPLEPFWHLYRQHFASDLPTRLLEHMLIGILHPADQEKVDEQMDTIYETEKDPFEDEPIRHAGLKVHGDQPLNAETPGTLIYTHSDNTMCICRHDCCPSHLSMVNPQNSILSFYASLQKNIC
jgi:sulfite oxidase